MIKFENIWTDDNKYLENNPDFSKQLLITLNQISFEPYSIYFTTNNEKRRTDLRIWWNKDFLIRSFNPEDLLKSSYYEKLTLFENNQFRSWQTTYYPNNLLIEKCTLDYSLDNCKLISIGIKLDQPINMYHDEQLKAIGSFIDDIIKLICKNWFSTINPNLFINNCLNQYYNNSHEAIIIITFNLKDFTNPLIQGDVKDNTMKNNEFIRDKLKNVLKPKSKLFKYLETHNLVDQLKSLNTLFHCHLD